MAKRGLAVRKSAAKKARTKRVPAKAQASKLNPGQILKKENTNLKRQLTEARGQLTAMSEILQIINTSAGALEPVFQAVLEKAMELCEAAFGFLTIYDGERFIPVAQRGVPDALSAYFAKGMDQPGPGEAHARLLAGEDIVHNLDQKSEEVYRKGRPLRRAIVDLGGVRSALVVALRKDGVLLGGLTIYRKQVRAFTPRQIALLQNFAAQAVIAIANVRLLEEVQARTADLRGSLQQQTATADVLKVISRSTFDLQTVLHTLVESAARLCDADKATITRQKGGKFYRSESFGVSSEFMDYVKNTLVVPDRGSASGRALLEGVAVHIPDVMADPDYSFMEGQKLGDFRTILGVPMLREGTPIGVLALTRFEARPFTDRQIELVTTFADQAAIAIENVRLFEEVQTKTRDLSEALTYQTGSSNILSVIASSPTDVEPVLEAIVESACVICAAYDAIVRLKVGNHLVSSAHHGPIPVDTDKWPIERDSVSGRALIDKTPVHVHDMQSADGDEFSASQQRARYLGHRTILSVPLLRESESLGVIILRRKEAHPFSDKQIALLQTFADQAVIAIENVRLFNETKEALEQQEASADILRAISSSVADTQPAFDKILDSCKHLFGSDETAVLLVDEEDIVTLGAYVGKQKEAVAATFPAPVEKSPAGHAIRAGRVVHYTDAANDAQLTRAVRHVAKVAGYEAMAYAPMMWNERGIGAIGVSRLKGAFSENELTLLQTFADQAVIAIQNARLFNETREALEQQKASAEVLSVISNSVSDTAPVFERILDSCERLFATDQVAICLVHDDAMIHARAVRGSAIRIMMSVLPQPVDQTATGRSFREQRVIHIPDAAALPNLPKTIRDAVGRIGNYSCVFAPMLWHQRGIGSICVMRQPPSPFTVKEIALLTTFADQAVIAIQNARLFDEVQERTRELSASLDELRTAQDRLIQTEKLASLGQLTAGIAHEIKNPLNFVNNFSALSAELTDELKEVLEPVALDGEVREAVDELTGLLKDNLEKVVQHGRRADSIVKNMLLHSREGSGDHRPADINALLDESLNLAYHGARAEKPDFNVTLQRDFDEIAGSIELFPQEITRVFLNLISNGFYAMTKRKAEKGDPAFEPLLGVTTRNLGDTVEIRIRDNGTGIPPEVKDKMFNPFFTTKPAGEGTGLGLSMSHDIIVKQHGGSIDVETELGQFTQFTIVLPRTGNVKSKRRGQP